MKATFFILLIVSFLAFGPADATSAEPSGKVIHLVQSGQSDAAIVIPSKASSELRKVADSLVDYIRQSSGATLPVELSSTDGRIEIHIGATPYAEGLKEKFADLNGDEFRILFPTDNRIVLIGGTEKGTEYAGYEFLERYVGVRWLFPGELGTYVPVSADLDVPVNEVSSQPVFISRTISTMQNAEPGEATHTWLKRHRNHWTIQHHHNVHRLFDPDKFYDDYPHFYPSRQGRPFRPAGGSYDWNPRLDAEGIVDFSVEQISRYFDENPHATSYSLGINDTNEFDYPSASINSVGLADYSDYFFRYANGVAEGVTAKYPDKWLGCLAYVGITDPPTETVVHPRIVPFICIDRQGWASEEHAQRDIQRTQSWHKAVPVLGWYDYIYGDDNYRIPRIYPRLMARYLQFAADNGVRAYYAEYYGSPAWAEGPKMYVLMKLLWDPNTDVEALLHEWYTLAVGEKAAEPLAQYYQLWEDYWMTRVRYTDWFKQNVGKVYFDFDRIGYLDQLTPANLAEAQRLMGEVVRLAETPEQKARAEFFSKGFNDIKRDVDYYVRLNGHEIKESAVRSSLFSGRFAPDGNPSDAIPQPWGGWQNEPGQSRFYWDHRIGYDDAHSLAIDAAEGGTGSAIIYRNFPVPDADGIYCLTAMIQADGVNDDADIGLEIRWEREDGQYLPRKHTANQFLRGSDLKQGEWTRFTLFFRPPADVGPVKMRVILGTVNARQGIIRYDNVGLATVDGREQETSH